jgi:hypothetical protein
MNADTQSGFPVLYGRRITNMAKLGHRASKQNLVR